MPTLPQYESRRNISTGLAQPIRNEAVASMQPLANAAGTVGDLAQKWSEAQDVMAFNEASATFNTVIASIEQKAALDPDYKNSDKYNDEIDKAVADSVKGIQNQQMAVATSTKFGAEAQISKIRIDTQFKKKGIEANKSILATNLDGLFNKRAYATGEQLTQIDNEISNLVTANVDAGLIGTLDAQEMMYKSIKKAYTNLVYDNPQQGLAALASDESLTKEDKRKLQDEAHAVIKKDKEFQDYQQKQRQTQATIEMSEALENGSLTPAMVQELQQQGVISTELAAIFDTVAIGEKYSIPDTTSLGEPEYFLRLLNNSMGDNPKIDKILSDAAQAYNEGKIGSNQYRYFIQEAKTTFDNKANGVNTKSKEQEGVYSAMKGLNSWVSDNLGWLPPVAMGNMVTKFFDRYKQGDDPNKLAQQITNEQVVESHPNLSSIPKEGVLMTDKNGVTMRVFSDGHFEEP